MDVYLIPLGPGRYELYCDEAGDTNGLVADAQPAGRFASAYEKFRAALARVEQERLSGHEPPLEGARSWSERAKDRMMSWIAEKVAEQRLLWRLRKESEITYFYPDDLQEDPAVEVARAELQREADRHLRWIIIDGVIFAASGVVALIPGPNLLAYYFGFRLVGHYLSRMGAKHGLTGVRWLPRANPQLSRLRQAITLGTLERDREVREVASELRLPHLARFFERTAVKTA